MALGTAFLCVKAVEYHEDYVEHIIPGVDYAPQGETLQHLLPGGLGHAEMFMCFYFMMTLVHAVHMIIGIAILGFMIFRAQAGAYTAGHVTFVENFGLYWHFVDIVWIFLFPLLYLISRHQ